MNTPKRSGPLGGVKIIEFAGIGPAPFASMLLSDMGADVVRIDRPGQGLAPSSEITSRGRRSIEMNLKDAADVARARDLVVHADVLIEGFRPGVMERLGLGPEPVMALNPQLVYARMTGWGQTGPLARIAGHDINYIALAGALSAIGPHGGHPVPPLNLVGDYGGGALYLVVGILAARLEAMRSGLGQVVDCAMCDGIVSLMSLFHSFAARGEWDDDKRGSNLLDGGAHFYTTYECADGRFIAVGALEPQFYEELCRLVGLDDPDFAEQGNRALWPELKRKAQVVFQRRTRQQWCDLLDHADACFAPVLTMAEAAQHPHLLARGSFVEIDGVVQAAPAPRFSRTPAAIQGLPPQRLTEAADVLREWSQDGNAAPSQERTQPLS